MNSEFLEWFWVYDSCEPEYSYTNWAQEFWGLKAAVFFIYPLLIRDAF